MEQNAPCAVTRAISPAFSSRPRTQKPTPAWTAGAPHPVPCHLPSCLSFISSEHLSLHSTAQEPLSGRAPMFIHPEQTPDTNGLITNTTGCLRKQIGSQRLLHAIGISHNVRHCLHEYAAPLCSWLGQQGHILMLISTQSLSRKTQPGGITAETWTSHPTEEPALTPAVTAERGPCPLLLLWK